MRHSSRRTCAMLATLLAALIAIMLPNPAAADPAVLEIGDDPGLGFNLISWGTGALEQHWPIAVQALYNSGFREVSIAPVRIVDPNTGIISAAGQQPLANIEAGIVHAKSLGMRVTLDPFTELPGFSPWRATFSPDPGAEETQFWGDYQAYMVEVAQLAQEHGVEAMTVGTEMKGLDDNPANQSHWNDVLTAVDAVYDGQIGYAANWDNYSSPNVVNNLWSHEAVDFIGIDSYFSNTLTNYYRFLNPGATNSQVNAGVNAWVDGSGSFPNQAFIDLITNAWNHKLDTELLPFAAELKNGEGMPIVFTEIGYQHHNRTARTPQVESGAVDTAEQRMAFQGLINALDGRADVFQAMHIWQWSMTGSNGSTWNIDPTPPVDQPDNTDLALLLQAFAGTRVYPLKGDYNRDGVVDEKDYTVWRDSLGQFVANYNAADGNGNGIIDPADYDAWKSNYGAGLGGGSVEPGAAPEPSSLALVLVASVMLMTRRSGRV